MPKFEMVIETEILWDIQRTWLSTTSVRIKSEAGDQRITDVEFAGLTMKATLRYGVDCSFFIQGYKELGFGVTLKFIRHRNAQ